MKFVILLSLFALGLSNTFLPFDDPTVPNTTNTTASGPKTIN